MIEEDILPFGRFKYPQPYTGSFKGMRYRIVHHKPAEGEEDLLYVDIWPGPFCYERTDKEKFISRTFEFSEKGYDDMVSFLNETYAGKESW